MEVKKKTVGKKKRGRKPKAPPMPEITFTTEELESIVNYMNFMIGKTDGRVLLKDQLEFDKLTKGMIRHIKKCENHILEVKRVVQTRQAQVSD